MAASEAAYRAIPDRSRSRWRSSGIQDQRLPEPKPLWLPSLNRLGSCGPGIQRWMGKSAILNGSVLVRADGCDVGNSTLSWTGMSYAGDSPRPSHQRLANSAEVAIAPAP